jgi:outer membrane autotransporter protein
VIAAAPTHELTDLPDGKINVAYPTQTLAAEGGTGPYIYTVSGLPEGLTFDGTDKISGTPTVSGTFPITIVIKDADGYETTKTQNIVIAAAPTHELTDLPDGKINVVYPTQTLAATGSTGPYEYTVTGLPEGVTFDGTDKISGTPTVSGPFEVTIVIKDKDGYETTKTQNIVIAAAPTHELTDLPDGKINVVYPTQTLAASNGTGPYDYTVTGLPEGLTFDGTDKISGTPTVDGTFPITIVIKDADGYQTTHTQNIVIAAAPAIEVTTLPDGRQNLDYGSHKLEATGGSGPYDITVTGLPEGLELNGDTISGTPTVSGPFEVTITIKDANGDVVVKKQTINIAAAPTIEVGSLPDGEFNVDYGSQKVDISGGTGPYDVTVTGLPDGLEFNGDTISGTPTQSGQFELTVTITDADGYTVTRTVTLNITKRPSLAAQHHELTVMAGTTGSVNLAQGATGGAVTSAAILSQPDASAGKAWVETGSDVQMLYFAASATFAGSAKLTYKLLSANGASDPATVTIRVIARPDPSEDAEVIGLVSAQVQTANRMAQMQIRNFQQRLEQLHGEGECRQDSIGLNVGLDGAQLNPKMPQVCTQRELSLWTAGEINMGKSPSEVNTKDKKLDHTSIGVSGGVDYRFSPSFIGGIGFGYGKDTTDVGEKGTQSRANMFSLAAYGSYRPGKSFFLDGVVGYGWLNFESDRFVTATGGMASGERKGQQLFGSVTLGYDYRNEAWLFSPYLRGDAAHTKLESFSETGAGIYNLTYGDQTADLLSATIGLRGEYTIPMSWGTLKPKARVEYTHDFAGNSRVKLGYTDIGGLLPYTIDANSTAKDSIRIEAGFDAMINGDWTAGLDYSTQIATEGGALEHSIRWKLSKQF